MRLSGTSIAPRILILVAACLPLVQSAPSQPMTSTRTLTGSVLDRQKEPLKGAIVEVQNESTMTIVSYITDANGSFSFKRLSADTDYRVTATYRGRKTKPRELSHFSSNPNPVVKFIIQLQ